MMKLIIVTPVQQKAQKAEESHLPAPNVIQAQTKNYLLYIKREWKKDKKGQPIKYYLDLFINTSLNDISIRSHYVS